MNKTMMAMIFGLLMATSIYAAGVEACCEPNITVSNWTECLNNSQFRTIDNGCGNVTTETINCCTLDITYGNWTECINDMQNRTVDDGCGNITTETQSCCEPDIQCTGWNLCTYGTQARTCDDGCNNTYVEVDVCGYMPPPVSTPRVPLGDEICVHQGFYPGWQTSVLVTCVDGTTELEALTFINQYGCYRINPIMSSIDDLYMWRWYKRQPASVCYLPPVDEPECTVASDCEIWSDGTCAGEWDCISEECVWVCDETGGEVEEPADNTLYIYGIILVVAIVIGLVWSKITKKTVPVVPKTAKE